jgi:hypothetical protein
MLCRCSLYSIFSLICGMSEGASDALQQLLGILPNVAPHRGAQALRKHHNNLQAAVEELMVSATGSSDALLHSAELQKKLQPIRICYDAQLDALTALPSRTMRQFVALFRLLRDEVRGFWATPACSPFKTQMETLLNILMADSRLRQVGLPLVASATDALVRPAGVSAADVSTNAEFVKASIPEVMTAGASDLRNALSVVSVWIVASFDSTPHSGVR